MTARWPFRILPLALTALAVALLIGCNRGTHPYKIVAIESSDIQQHVDQPISIAVDQAGTVYFADPGTCGIWKLANGAVIMVTADACPKPGEPPSSLPTLTGSPFSLAVDNHGSLFVGLGSGGGIGGGIVRLDGNSVVPVAPCMCSPEIDASAAKSHSRPPELDFPVSLAVAPDGTIFAGDRCRVLEVHAGTVTSVVGGPRCLDAGYSGDASALPTIAAEGASLGEQPHVALQPDGTLLVADPDLCRIWKIDGGQQSPFAGTGLRAAGAAGECTSSGDGAVPLQTSISPTSVAVDGRGVVYFSDRECRVRTISTNGRVETAAEGICGLLAAAPTTGVYVWDTESKKLFTVTPHN